MAARSIDVAGANANTPLSPVLSPRSMSDGESINTDEELDLFEFLLETNAPTTEVSLSRLQAATVDPKTKGTARHPRSARRTARCDRELSSTG